MSFFREEGTIIGRKYKIANKIGSGSFGVVYKGINILSLSKGKKHITSSLKIAKQDVLLDRSATIKLLDTKFTNNKGIQSVLIFGIGGIGLNIAYASSLVSAFPIVGVDIHKDKIKMGKQFGLTHGVLNSNNLNKDMNKIFGNKGPDIVFETTGHSKIMEKAYEITPNDSKTIFVGVPNDKISIYSLPLAFNKSLKVSHGGETIPDEDIPRYIRLLKNKKINFDKLISHEFDLENINDAIGLFRTGKAGRIIIKINKEN